MQQIISDTLSSSSSEGLSLQLILLLIIQLMGMLLNSTVLFVICRRYKRLELKKRYILLVNLLLCDFILLFWVMPSTARLLSCSSPECLSAVLSNTVCSITGFLFQFTYICGILTQAFLALDRALSTVEPTLFVTYMTTKVYASVLVFSWTFSGVHALIPLVPSVSGVSYIFNDHLKRCSHPFNSACWYENYITFLVQCVLSPLILVSYVYMIYKIWRLSLRMKSAIPRNMKAKSLVISGQDVQVQASKQWLLAFKSSSDGRSLSKSVQTRGADDTVEPYSIRYNETQISTPLLTTSAPDQTSQYKTITTEVVIEEPEIRQYRPLPREVVNKETQTSDASKVSYSEVSDASFFETLQGHSAVSASGNDTTIRDFSTNMVSGINLIPSDDYDLKGFILTQRPSPDVLETNNASVLGSFGSLNITTDFYLMNAKSLTGEKHPPICGHHGVALMAKAMRKSLNRGLSLLFLVYSCSLPYAMASKCPRGDMSFTFSIAAVWLYYSSCIWYPLVYFFWHDNFVQHLRISISTI